MSRWLDEVEDLDAHLATLEHELAEAEAEIERHHELIVKMRELLDTASIYLRSGEFEPGDDYAFGVEVATFLNTEVG